MPAKDAAELERLQKFLARSGVASRRASEEMIRQGRVMLNGEVVREMGVRIDPARDEVLIDGQPVRPEQHEYWAVYKPVGFVSTVNDTHGRPTVVQLVKSQARLYPVGRLDADSEGLMLLTNDGELSQKLLHPGFEHEKEYMVLVRGQLSISDIRTFGRGILLEGETEPASAVVERAPRYWSWRGHRSIPGESWVRVVLRQGQKRQIRRMMATVHCHVRRIIRVRIGNLELGRLQPEGVRRLSADEVKALRQFVGL